MKGHDALVRVELFGLDGSRSTFRLRTDPSRGLAVARGDETVFVAATDGIIALSLYTGRLLDERDINRDAKWRRLAMNECPGGDIGASPAAWRCQSMR